MYEACILTTRTSGGSLAIIAHYWKYLVIDNREQRQLEQGLYISAHQLEMFIPFSSTSELDAKVLTIGTSTYDLHYEIIINNFSINWQSLLKRKLPTIRKHHPISAYTEDSLVSKVPSFLNSKYKKRAFRTWSALAHRQLFEERTGKRNKSVTLLSSNIQQLLKYQNIWPFIKVTIRSVSYDTINTNETPTTSKVISENFIWFNWMIGNYHW